MLDTRLGELGGSRFYARGETDERTGMSEVEPWIEGLWPALAKDLEGGEGEADGANELDVAKLNVTNE